MPTPTTPLPGCLAIAAALAVCAAGSAQSLAEHYGFEPLEVIKIEKGAGPVTVADMDSDGRTDIIAVNNRNSRIDVLLQKAGASPNDPPPPLKSVNEIPQHWRFRRVEVPVSEEVGATIPFDFDGDGLMDLVYAGAPGRIVFMRQSAPGVFEVARKHTVRNLNPTRDALAIANVTGDAKPELIGIVSGRIQIWPLDGTDIGSPTELSSGTGNIVALLVDDFDGDGTNDIVGVLPDDAAPVRAWFGTDVAGAASLGPQMRFEMPPLREATSVRIKGQNASMLGVIERPSRRTVLYKVQEKPATSDADREAGLQTWSFADPSNRKRRVACADINGDGLPDLVATNTESNAISTFLQVPGRGFVTYVNSPAYSDLEYIAARDVDGDGRAEVFVSSEKEGVVGRADPDAQGSLGFPVTLPLPGGSVPVALGVVPFDGRSWTAVVTKDGRNYALELQAASGDAMRLAVPLGSLSRAPDTVLAVDADRDGLTDLLLFTPEKPMMMLRRTGDKEGVPTFALLESKDMAQFGLAQAANAQNTAVADINGDGNGELLVADRNFIRALRYDPSAGWQVVGQINAPRGDAKLVSIALMGDRIVAADRENGKMLLFARGPGGQWSQQDAIDTKGFKFNSIEAGKFAGGTDDAILLIGDDGFGVIRFGGTRRSLHQLDSWRPEGNERVPHEIGVGDVNGDGLTDILTLDAGKQMLDILAVSEGMKLMPAQSFRIFESRLFSSGEPREFEPSQVLVADVTGDGADDVILMCHDRVLLYPQMRSATPTAGSGPGS
jgi:hypothetical protein